MTEFQAVLDFIMDWILLLVPLFLLQLALLTAALISIAYKRATGMEKLPWILLVILLNIFGPIIYFVIGSNKLDEKAARREDSEWQ